MPKTPFVFCLDHSSSYLLSLSAPQCRSFDDFFSRCHSLSHHVAIDFLNFSCGMEPSLCCGIGSCRNTGWHWNYIQNSTEGWKVSKLRVSKLEVSGLLIRCAATHSRPHPPSPYPNSSNVHFQHSSSIENAEGGTLLGALHIRPQRPRRSEYRWKRRMTRGLSVRHPL